MCTNYCYFLHVWPANQPSITGVVLCLNKAETTALYPTRIRDFSILLHLLDGKAADTKIWNLKFKITGQGQVYLCLFNFSLF
jgi:hypothetical protein